MSSPYSSSFKIEYSDGDTSLERIPTALISGSTNVHTVLDGETLQSIAYKYYGDSGRWGDIADVNSIYFFFEEIEAGTTLIIPQ